jgi:C4-type Zn-finger protein
MTCPLCAGRMSVKGPLHANTASAEPTLATAIECETCGYAVASTQYAVPAPTPLLRAQFAGLGGTTS